jgi:ribosomal protein L14
LYLKTSPSNQILGTLGYASAGDWRKIYVKKKNKKKNNKFRFIFARTRQVVARGDGSTRRYFENSGLILKKRLHPKNIKVKGSTIMELGYQRFINLFKYAF